MTISHHIGEDMLLAYASGALGEAWSLLVATHATLCPRCRGIVRDLEAIGGELLDSLDPVPGDPDAFDRVMQRLARAAPDPRPAPAPLAGPPPVLPEPLRRYLGTDLPQLAWRRLTPGAHHVPLQCGKRNMKAFLLKVPAGLPVPAHGHTGQELTLVLSGTFSDHHLHFARGDVQEADADLEHQPLADGDEDCVCLVVTGAPLRFRSWAARLLQPFIRI